MYNSTAQTVIDNETKYRSGIRIGNFAEEILAKDYDKDIKKLRQIKMGESMSKRMHGLSSTVYEIRREKIDEPQKDYELITQQQMRGENYHILFGHGINTKENSEFNKREFRTTNELAYNQKIKPQKFLSSKFHPQLIGGRHTLTYDSEKQNMTTLGKSGSNVVQDVKHFRHYAEFTKKFDLPSQKLNLRK